MGLGSVVDYISFSVFIWLRGGDWLRMGLPHCGPPGIRAACLVLLDRGAIGRIHLGIIDSFC